MITGQNPHGLDIFTDHTGADRVLAKLQPDPAKLMAFPRFADHFQKIDRKDWLPVSHRHQFTWILNQLSHGSCTDHAGCYVHRKTRVLAGMADVDLSSTFGYAQVNGGRDQGAMVSDILNVMQTKGRCLRSEVGVNQIYLNQIPASAYQTALRFKVTEAYTLADFDEIGSAITLGFIPAFAVQVGNNFENFDHDGAIGIDRGAGNHAIHADGLIKTPKGRWLLDMENSWGQWGPNGDGRAAVPQEAIDNNVQQDAYCVRVALVDPQDPNNPPAAN